MNINQSINKLLYALSTKNQFYKIGSNKCYSEDKQKYFTLYYIYKYNGTKYEYEESTYSKVDVLKYLVKELKEGEANETN